MSYAVAQVAAILATALFIFSLYWMNDPKTARHAVVAGVTGMLVAVLATWFQPEIVHHGWIVLAIVAGFAVGVPLSLVPLTAVPQRTALSHAFGGLAAGLVGTAEYFLGLTEHPAQLTAFRTSAIVAEVILGPLNLPSTLPLHASQMYARNISSFLLHVARDGKLVVDFDDEIIRETCVTHAGEVRKT